MSDGIFFFNDTATTEIYTLSLHDALPISGAAALPAELPLLPRRLRAGRRAARAGAQPAPGRPAAARRRPPRGAAADRKSTRLNSSHANISYAVFCLKKKKVHHLYHTLCLH